MLARNPRKAAVWLALGLAFAPGVAAAQTLEDVATFGGCSTEGVEIISAQLAAAQECYFPGDFLEIPLHDNIVPTSDRVRLVGTIELGDALFEVANTYVLLVNSAFRTMADQFVLYESGGCSAAAIPGSSNHQTGRAVDLENWDEVEDAMIAAGCDHPLPVSDPVHFDCPGPDLRYESVVTFQRLWNLNNPLDPLDEDGDYGPETRDRLAEAPLSGFELMPCSSPDPTPSPPEDDAGVDVPPPEETDGGVVSPPIGDAGMDLEPFTPTGPAEVEPSDEGGGEVRTGGGLVTGCSTAAPFGSSWVVAFGVLIAVGASRRRRSAKEK